jgi:tetratricopeptide (TPR) repeat protein
MPGGRQSRGTGRQGEMEELLERYEAGGDESVYAEARRSYEQALAADGDARLLMEFGYLQELHGSRSIRAAVECYEQAIDADPQYDKPHWQLIDAMATLGQAAQAVSRYQQWAAAAPADLRPRRFLAAACMSARDYDNAGQVIRDGLELAPDDPMLTVLHGELLEAAGRPDDALAAWQHAVTLGPDDMSPRYSLALLLERQGRLAEAVAQWRAIITWCEEHGYAISADWPRRELRRLETRLAGS